MSMCLEEKAAEIVGEMISLGAVFETSCVDGIWTWAWEARPSVMRNAIAIYFEGVAEVEHYGFREAMLMAILRANQAEALL